MPLARGPKRKRVSRKDMGVQAAGVADVDGRDVSNGDRAEAGNGRREGGVCSKKLRAKRNDLLSCRDGVRNLRHRHHSPRPKLKQRQAEPSVSDSLEPVVTRVVSGAQALQTAVSRVITEIRTVTVDVPETLATARYSDKSLGSATPTFADPPIQNPSPIPDIPSSPLDTSTILDDTITATPTEWDTQTLPLPTGYTTVTSLIVSGNGTSVITGDAATTTVGSTVIVLVPGTLTTTTIYTTTTRIHSNSSTTSTTSSASIRTTTSSSSTETTTTLTPLPTPDSNGNGYGNGGGVIPDGRPPPPESPPPSSDTSSGGLPPHKAKLVGGIVGAFAGLALIFLALFYIRRRQRRTPSRLRISDATLSEKPYIAALGAMFHRRSTPPEEIPPPIAGAPGFVKVKGRKLDTGMGRSPIGSGRETVQYEHSWAESGPTSPSKIPPRSPFDDPVPPHPQGQVERGTVRFSGAGTSTLSSPVSPHGDDDEISAMGPVSTERYRPRPGSSMSGATQMSAAGPSSRPAMGPRQRSLIEGRDGVGRSLPGQDGSRGSRFTEDLG